MENRGMGGNRKFGEKDNFDVGQENVYTSTFSNFIPPSTKEDHDLMFPQIFMQQSLPTLHSGEAPN